MKPTIGRIVHYQNTDLEKPHKDAPDLSPAIITRVVSDDVVGMAGKSLTS